MRFVHLTPESRARGIQRAGLKGTKASVVGTAGASMVLGNAVYAMPVIADFWTTFQWLRELRRFHDERMLAVYFRLPDDELVHVGRYGQPHVEMTASAAAAWVMKNPTGAEVVVPRRVAGKDILAIRQVRQLVGWTQNPSSAKSFDCVCPACLPGGDRLFMRRIRAAYSVGMTAVRRAGTDDELLAALGRLDIPLERARGRIEPKGLLAFTRSENPKVRRTVARLLGQFRAGQVQDALAPMLRDSDSPTRLECVEALLRTAGLTRTVELLAGEKNAGEKNDGEQGSEAVVHLVELIEYQPVDDTVIAALERFVAHPTPTVREAVVRVARALLEDRGDGERHRRRLETLAGAPELSK